ncbi:MAG: tetratricopeptide repeat protein [Candidatus Eremiobacterota bacterium]
MAMKYYMITELILFMLLSVMVPVKAESAAEYYNTGNKYYNSGDYFQAIECYKKAVSIDPSFADAYYNMGNAYYMLKDLARSDDSYKNAIKADNNHIPSCYNLGLNYQEEGLFEESLKLFNQVLTIDPSRNEIHYDKGVSYYSINNYEKALEEFHKYLELNHSGDKYAEKAAEYIQEMEALNNNDKIKIRAQSLWSIEPSGKPVMAEDFLHKGSEQLVLEHYRLSSIYYYSIMNRENGKWIEIARTGNLEKYDCSPSAVIGDLNGDGIRELLVAQRRFLYCYTMEKGKFKEKIYRLGNNDIRSISAGDLDKDGKDELVALVQTVNLSNSIYNYGGRLSPALWKFSLNHPEKIWQGESYYNFWPDMADRISFTGDITGQGKNKAVILLGAGKDKNTADYDILTWNGERLIVEYELRSSSGMYGDFIPVTCDGKSYLLGNYRSSTEAPGTLAFSMLKNNKFHVISELFPVKEYYRPLWFNPGDGYGILYGNTFYKVLPE